jgi:hypothetical protein
MKKLSLKLAMYRHPFLLEPIYPEIWEGFNNINYFNSF